MMTQITATVPVSDDDTLMTRIKSFTTIDPEEGGCWHWKGWRSPRPGKPVATIWSRKMPRSVIRELARMAGRQTPPGHVLRRACGTADCVRLDHYKTISLHDLAKACGLRGFSETKQTACLHGHPFDEANTYWHKGRRGMERCCRRCNRERQAKRRRLAR
jgi:hypothetical protein